MLSAPQPTYPHVERLHRFLAEADAPDPRPWLLAFAAEELLALVGLRPFAQGHHHGPLIEAMALALPIGADRVSVALPGRIWSLDDPVPPVTPEADLRQRALTQVTVDGSRRATPAVHTRLHPFGLADDRRSLVWDDAVDPGPGEGWIPDALSALVEARDRIGPGSAVDEHRRQLARLDALGHDVLLGPLGRRRLGL